jgi:prophage maintenance system killer protein
VKEPIWLDERDALALHDRLLVLHGGAAGLRDGALLKSALARPRQGFAYAKSPDLEHISTSWNQLGLLGGAAVRQEGRAARCGASRKRPDEADARRRQTPKGTGAFGQGLRQEPWPYAGYDLRSLPGPWPNSLCPSDSIWSNYALADMAAAYTAGIVRNHPFVDGNKRTGFLMGILFLEINGRRFIASEEDATQAVMELAAGNLDETGYGAFIRANMARGKK